MSKEYEKGLARKGAFQILPMDYEVNVKEVNREMRSVSPSFIPK